MFHFNNFNKNNSKDVDFNSNSNFRFLKPVMFSQIYLSNKNWIIYAEGEKLFIKKLNKITNNYEIKFTIT
jgi:hypothetical protein|tara:strand:- start:315 stop:524 length:210 start_codon:yes stop_codon:yes gene_type:complete